MKTDFMARRTFKKGAKASARAEDFPALAKKVAEMMKKAWPKLDGVEEAERSVATAVVALLDAEKLLAKSQPASIPAALREATGAATDLDAVRAALDLLE